MNRKLPVLAAVALILTIAIILVGSYFPKVRPTFAQKGEIAVEKCIYLTFDDGPSDKVTPKILDILKDEKVPATFFIVGANAKPRLEILKRAHAEGHTLGVHSYSHRYSEIYSSAEALLKDIKACNEVIFEATGEYSEIYRFPGGSFTVPNELKSAVAGAGYTCVDWNASFRDSEIKGATAEDIFNSARNTLAYPDNVVMLAHDGTDKLATAAALTKVIRYFKGKGYVFKAF